MSHWFIVLAVSLFASSVDAGPSRLTGRINSIAPTEGVVFVEDGGDEDADHLVAVEFRSAQVVRVWRDPEDPAEWRERSTQLSRWPVGTFIVIIGVADASGRVRAHRIEIPKADRQ